MHEIWRNTQSEMEKTIFGCVIWAPFILHVVGCVRAVRYGTAYGRTSTTAVVVCNFYSSALSSILSSFSRYSHREMQAKLSFNYWQRCHRGWSANIDESRRSYCMRSTIPKFICFSLSFCRRFKPNHVLTLYSLFSLVVFSRSLCYASCTSSHFTILDSCHGWKVVISICIFPRCLCVWVSVSNE